MTKGISEKAPELKVHSGEGSPYGLFIADNSKYFNAELKEPDAQNFIEAIGFGLYSNSRASVDSFKSFFELLWNKPLTEPLLEEDEIKSYLEEVIREVRITKEHGG
ncbi:MAG TPA: hypothetical protein VEL70_07230 [Candidatus Acidoferrum sp.]|nr:hypothetical protein [Candidatus Acidoferrum sp.]